MKIELRYFKGILFLNIASINILLKGGIRSFSNFVIEIKRAYLQKKMNYHKIKMIRLEEIAKKNDYDFFLPVNLCKPGSTPWYDLLVLATLVKKFQPEVIFEIGSFEGLGSAVMCNNCSAKLLYTLDLPPKKINSMSDVSKFAKKDHSIGFAYKSGKFLKLVNPDVKVNRLGDSWNFDFSLFIDGAHTYRYVLKDTLNAIRCVQKGGIIAWHNVKNTQVLNVIFRITQYLEVVHVLNSNICFAVNTKDSIKVLEVLTKKLRNYER